MAELSQEDKAKAEELESKLRGEGRTDDADLMARLIEAASGDSAAGAD